MKRLPKYLLISIITFLIGVVGVSFWFFVNRNHLQSTKSETAFITYSSTAKIKTETVDKEDEFQTPLDSVWLKDEKTLYNGYVITKRCSGNVDSDSYCQIKILKNNKTLASFESNNDYWIQYGLFNFLGRNEKQLIVQIYSGGANCCYDYLIYDLKPSFRVIYDSSKLNGYVIYNLIPVDIDGNGVFEFQQTASSFDHAYSNSTFPPAVFSYNIEKGRYVLANKKFPNYILGEWKKNVDGLDDWVNENEKYGNHITQEELNKTIVSDTFIYLVYAGKEKDAWLYFNEIYNYEDKEDFRKVVKKLFAKDPVYISIYSK